MTTLSPTRRYLILAVCCMSLFIVGLDNTIVNIALPAIRRDLHASLSGLQWTIDAYVVVLATLLTLSGSTADRIGRRRVFQTGLVVFTLGSLLCSVAPNLGWLIAFRVLQAIGGSMLNPVALSIISNTFTTPAERARAFGFWGGVVGLSMALGPVVGGVLVDAIGWRSIFWLNVPFGVAAIVLSALLVPESRAPHPRRLDPGGQVLVCLMLASLTYAIIEGPGRGWGSPLIIGGFAVSVASLGTLLWWESRRTEPLLDLAFFRSAPFTGATLLAVTGFGAVAGFLFLNPIYLQNVRGYSALHAGLYTLPMAGMTALLAPVTGRIVAKRGGRVPLIVSGLGMTAGGLLLTDLTPHTSAIHLIAAYLLIGAGFGTLNVPITNAAISGMPVAQAGLAGAIASTSRQVGQALGVAVIGSAVTASIRGPLETGFAAASHVGWWILAGCGVVLLAVGLVSTSAWAKGTAAAVRDRMDQPADLTPPSAGEPKTHFGGTLRRGT